MTEDNVKCAKCGSSFNKMFLMGKQGNADVCPLCGADMQNVDEHPDWITWYYYGYKSDKGKTTYLNDQPIDLNEHGDIFFHMRPFRPPWGTIGGICRSFFCCGGFSVGGLSVAGLSVTGLSVNGPRAGERALCL